MYSFLLTEGLRKSITSLPAASASSFKRKAAIMQVSKKKPTTIATTSSIKDFASPMPSIGLEPDVKSDSFISDELAAEAVFINAILKSNSKSAVLQNGFNFPIYQTYTHTVSYTHLRAHETGRNLVCRLLLDKKKTT